MLCRLHGHLGHELVLLFTNSNHSSWLTACSAYSAGGEQERRKSCKKHATCLLLEKGNFG